MFLPIAGFLAAGVLATEERGQGGLCWDSRTPFCSSVGSQNPRHYCDKFITSHAACAAHCSWLTRAGFLLRSTSCPHHYLNLLFFELRFRDTENSCGFEDLANLELGTSRFTKAILCPLAG